jgi:hypothetical protein
MYEYHCKALPSPDIDEVRRGIVRRLRHHDSRFAFALLWIRLDPEAHKPKLDEDPPKLPWPQINLEFDFAGGFSETAQGWVYNGAEAKFSSSCTFLLLP